MTKLHLDIQQHVDGLTAEAVEGTHAKDLETLAKYGVKYLKYWFDEGTGKVFCLVEAPNKEAAIAVHREAHGLIADQVIEFQEGKYWNIGPHYPARTGAEVSSCVSKTNANNQ